MIRLVEAKIIEETLGGQSVFVAPDIDSEFRRDIIASADKNNLGSFFEPVALKTNCRRCTSSNPRGWTR